MVPSISIVIPAYNEAARLSRSLGQMASFLRTYQTAELLVVDDGSSDGTAEVAERYLSEHCSVDWRVLRLPTNRGKGCAVRHGLLAARAPVALFSDADLSTPITEMPKLVDVICDGSCDVAFGSRALDRRLIETRQPFIAIARAALSMPPCGSRPGSRFPTLSAASKRSEWQPAVKSSSRPRSMGSASMSNCCSWRTAPASGCRKFRCDGITRRAARCACRATVRECWQTSSPCGGRCGPVITISR